MVSNKTRKCSMMFHDFPTFSPMQLEALSKKLKHPSRGREYAKTTKAHVAGKNDCETLGENNIIASMTYAVRPARCTHQYTSALEIECQQVHHICYLVWGYLSCVCLWSGIVGLWIRCGLLVHDSGPGSPLPFARAICVNWLSQALAGCARGLEGTTNDKAADIRAWPCPS